MLGFRQVRFAEISKAHRDIFERYGETVIQLMVAASFERYGESVVQVMIAPNGGMLPNVVKLEADQTMVEKAALWLTEQADIDANREWRLEVVEFAILIFVACGVVIESGLAKYVAWLLGVHA